MGLLYRHLTRGGVDGVCGGLCLVVVGDEAVMVSAIEILVKLRCHQVANLRDEYTTDDAEHDQLVLESYLNIERKKGGRRHGTK